jgi:hypothetical protein
MRRFPFVMILLLVGACIDPLRVDLEYETKRIVVDGEITNRPGPYEVKLFYSNPLSISKLIPFEPVTQAVVTIHDDIGNVALLTEAEPGLYKTNGTDIQGVVDRSYYLTIQTEDGKEYKSNIQKLTAAGVIQDVYFEFEKDGLPGTQIGEFQDALKVFIDAKGETAKENLFRWRWTTIYKAISNPELRSRSTPGGEIPIPEPCSGYVYQNRRLIQVGPCTCCTCWSYNYSASAKVSNNDWVSDYEFNKQYLGKIPITAMTFYDKYYLEAEQLSLSAEAYEFWNLVEKQQSGASNLFQPNTIKVRGNISCTSNPDEEVLGFFGVSGVVSKNLYIDENEVPYAIPGIEVIPYSCKSYFFNSTTEKPTFW